MSREVVLVGTVPDGAPRDLIEQVFARGQRLSIRLNWTDDRGFDVYADVPLRTVSTNDDLLPKGAQYRRPPGVEL